MSNESTSILEWLESPITDKKLTLTVKKNQMWSKEIRQYVNQEDDIVMVEDSGDKLIFKLK